MSKTIETILSLLNESEHYGVSEVVDFAKGSHKAPETIKEGINILRRRWQRKKR